MDLPSIGPASRRGLWTLLVAGALAVAGGTVGLARYLWPQRTGGQFDAGRVEDFTIGDVKHFSVRVRESQVPPESLTSAHPNARDFHLVRRLDGFVAFWHRCTHLGCTVPYRPDFEWPANGRAEKGLFRCPCHGSTYSRDEAAVVFGPAPRGLDALPVRIHNGHVLVTVAEGAERRRAPQEHAPVTRVT